MAFPLPRRLRTVFSKNLSGLPILFLVGAAFLAAGCHPRVSDPKDPKFIVAEKGDWQVLRADLDAHIATYMKENHLTAEQVGPEKMPMLETAMLENMVLKKLILDKAAAMQLKDVDKEEAADLDRLKGPATDQEFGQHLQAAGMTLDQLKQNIHEKVLIGRVLEAEAFKNDDPTDQEIDDIYLKYKDRFVMPPKIRASRVLIHVDDTTSAADKVAKKKAIDLAHARVVKGEDFSKVATEVSEDRSSAPKGGDIGSFPQGVNEPGFDEVAFATKEGAVSPVFETSLGYQFVKVTGVEPGGPIPIADARSFIANKLRQGKMQKQQKDYSDMLLDKGGVIFHLVRVDLPPPSMAPSGGPPPSDAPPADAPASAPAPSQGGAPPQ